MEKRVQLNIYGIFLTVPRFTIMKVSPSAGKMSEASMLVNVPGLVTASDQEKI
jgi:hypothetical protein